ncbi:hypothetical protein BKA83DRAFT_2177742 [Pisolithus microcarpus]|nr:hypothetical protein BKA83DRAFT_2177742 [Pisolithus microcarpus]
MHRRYLTFFEEAGTDTREKFKSSCLTDGYSDAVKTDPRTQRPSKHCGSFNIPKSAFDGLILHVRRIQTPSRGMCHDGASQEIEVGDETAVTPFPWLTRHECRPDALLTCGPHLIAPCCTTNLAMALKRELTAYIQSGTLLLPRSVIWRIYAKFCPMELLRTRSNPCILLNYSETSDG